MPQIGENLWKVALSFYWWRQYQDGRIEQEFDLDTGQIRPWGETPANPKRVSWRPVTPDLAQKMQAFGEFGLPTMAPPVTIDLKPGEELIIFKDCVVCDWQVVCKACQTAYHTLEDLEACPRCGAKPSWKCEKCGKLLDGETCPDCGEKCRYITPFERRADKWEAVTYLLGIKDKFLLKFNSHGLIAEH
jgi:predicted RNA-binding Zn-ribbon protein involved in translation (DUF1610 family)